MVRVLRSTVPVALLAAFAACIPNDDTRKTTVSSDTRTSQQESAEIVFRGRYYMSKECRQGPNGEQHVLGLHPVCDVLEVLTGQLKLERLLDVEVPGDLQEGEHTFRWKPSESTLKEVQKAEAGGYTGMWLGGARLEVLP